MSRSARIGGSGPELDENTPLVELWHFTTIGLSIIFKLVLLNRPEFNFYLKTCGFSLIAGPFNARLGHEMRLGIGDS
jgi:hypothetical protein